ncbi:MAG TPA: peptidylprolyl isomerase [Candidatus Paceibacterota bacterium]|nr:peptidylprolyl isomerase [Verrucomicrobiota bacterium]HSA09101.1 peptidylprolyl isomerase [Candidatus Paceibacterota bacterium]
MEHARNEAFWSSFMPRHRTLVVVAGAWLGLALILATHAELPTNQLPAGQLLPTGDTNTVATYDGGSITAGDLAEYSAEPHFLADAERNAPTNAISLDEKVARHLAALRILVGEARQRGLDQEPGWKLQAKLMEQRVLSRTLIEEIRQGVFLSDKEVADYYEANKFKLLTIQAIEARRIGISAQKHGDQALARAKEALALIRGGQDFGAVAKRYSDLDLKTAQTNTYPPDLWGKEGVMALAELGEGKVSDPLPVADGFELVKVVQMQLPANISREEAMHFARQVLAGELAGRRMEEMMKAAETAFPFVNVQTNPPSSNPNHQLSTPHLSTNGVLRCGQFVLTEEDIGALAGERASLGMPTQELLEMIKRDHGQQIQLGEMARGMGLDKRPGFQQRLRYELNKRLAYQSTMALIPEYLAGLQFEESRLADHYQDQWKGTVDARLDYDVLVVPLGVAADASAEDRETARTNALAKAKTLIARFWEGTAFEQLAGGDASLQLITGQSRLFQAGSMLEPLVAGLQPGQIALEPFEDFGGYCVIRVNKYEASRKTPYEMARPYIAEHFRRQVEMDLRRDFEPFLLEQKHFKFKPAAAGPAASDPKPMGESGK